MSHIVRVQTQVRDAAAVRAACQRMNLPAPVQGKAKLFSGKIEGLAVQLPDWVYPVIVDLLIQASRPIVCSFLNERKVLRA